MSIKFFRTFPSHPVSRGAISRSFERPPTLARRVTDTRNVLLYRSIPLASSRARIDNKVICYNDTPISAKKIGEIPASLRNNNNAQERTATRPLIEESQRAARRLSLRNYFALIAQFEVAFGTTMVSVENYLQA